MVDKIRAKQAAKPKHSPLPEQVRIAPVATDELPAFPAMLRQMWSGGAVQEWIDDNIKPLVQERHFEFHATEPKGCTHDLQGLADKLLTPREIKRDESGYYSHPDMPAFDEGVRTDVFLAALGLEYTYVDMDGDAPHLMDNEGDGEHKLGEWTPTLPESDWFLLEIGDAEDGPYAMFVRRESPPEYTVRMHSKRYPEWVNRDTVPGDLSSGVVFRAHYAGLQNMREWMLGCLPSALRAIVYPVSFPPIPAWIRDGQDFRVGKNSLAYVAGDQHTAIQQSLECAALWLENGSDPLQAAAEIRLAAARVKPPSEPVA